MALEPSTPQDIITSALRQLNVLGESETPAAAMTADALRLLNQFIDGLSIQRQAIVEVRRTVHALVAGQPQYTIGPGGDFDQTRPIAIDRWSVIPDPGVSAPLELQTAARPLTLDAWQRITSKQTVGSMPTALYYDHAHDDAGRGHVDVWPIPSTSRPALVLYTPEPLSADVRLTTHYQFPPGWARMLRLNLSVELAPEYGVQPPPRLVQAAGRALRQIKNANLRPKESALDPALTTGTRGAVTLFT